MEINLNHLHSFKNFRTNLGPTAIAILAIFVLVHAGTFLFTETVFALESDQIQLFMDFRVIKELEKVFGPPLSIRTHQKDNSTSISINSEAAQITQYKLKNSETFKVTSINGIIKKIYFEFQDPQPATRFFNLNEISQELKSNSGSDVVTPIRTIAIPSKGIILEVIPAGQIIGLQIERPWPNKNKNKKVTLGKLLQNH